MLIVKVSQPIIRIMLEETATTTTQSAQSEGVGRVYRQRFDCEMGLTLEHDPLAIEEPLQISVQWQDTATQILHTQEWSMTMRTPGDDVHLIRGLLLSQQIVDSLDQILNIEMADEEACNADNHWLVTLNHQQAMRTQGQERRYVSQSSCGICGLTSIKALALHREIRVDSETDWLTSDTVMHLPAMLASRQPLFAETGAVHGAGYFAGGEFIAAAEDVGRHNAVDKLIGRVVSEQRWHPQGVLILSGRVSFELMQKAAIAHIPVVVAVGAPSKLAVDMARQFDITLIGFTKRQQFNIYHGRSRLQSVRK